MKKPNFFIIGAPKCGTTAMASYLSAHPNVFVTNPKEPHHYNFDLNHGRYKNREHYLSLFSSVDEKNIAVGEASVWYLYSKEAVKNIIEDNPYAKIIVMLRNPVDMAHSLHNQMVFSGAEPIKNFETAWKLQSARRNGHNVPLFCDEPKLLSYFDACSLGTQFQRLRQLVPEQNILPIVFDDFSADTTAIWAQVLEFLNVPETQHGDFPVINPAKGRRSLYLKRMNDLYAKTRHLIGVKGFGTGGFARLNEWNEREKSKASISVTFFEELKHQFNSEVKLLEELLNRDLSVWN